MSNGEDFERSVPTPIQRRIGDLVTNELGYGSPNASMMGSETDENGLLVRLAAMDYIVGNVTFEEYERGLMPTHDEQLTYMGLGPMHDGEYHPYV